MIIKSFYLDEKELSLISNAMKAKKTNQLMLSKETGIDESAISKYFSQKIKITISNYEKICNHLGIEDRQPEITRLQLDSKEPWEKLYNNRISELKAKYLKSEPSVKGSIIGDLERIIQTYQPTK